MATPDSLHCPGCRARVPAEQLIAAPPLARCPHCQYLFLIPHPEPDAYAQANRSPSALAVFGLGCGGLLAVALCCGGGSMLSIAYLRPDSRSDSPEAPSPVTQRDSAVPAASRSAPLPLPPRQRSRRTARDGRVTELLSTLRRGDAPVAEKLTALSQLHTLPRVDDRADEVSQVVADLLLGGESAYQFHGGLILQQWGTAAVVPQALELLDSENIFVRKAAFKIVGEHASGPEVADRLAPLLAGRGFDRDAVQALSAMGSSAEDAVLSLLSDPKQEAERDILDVLKAVGGQKSLDLLEERLARERSPIQRARLSDAAQAIRSRLSTGQP
jgi:hypothetical protein